MVLTISRDNGKERVRIETIHGSFEFAEQRFLLPDGSSCRYLERTGPNLRGSGFEEFCLYYCNRLSGERQEGPDHHGVDRTGRRTLIERGGYDGSSKPRRDLVVRSRIAYPEPARSEGIAPLVRLAIFLRDLPTATVREATERKKFVAEKIPVRHGKRPPPVEGGTTRGSAGRRRRQVTKKKRRCRRRVAVGEGGA